MKKISSTKYVFDMADLEKIGIKGAQGISNTKMCHTKAEDKASYAKGCVTPFDSMELTVIEETEV